MPQTIALVDDDRNILTSLSMTLEQEGYTVRTYTDGESALQGLMAKPADLAVLDIKMPRMDGMELLQRLRARSAMPVIFLTAQVEESAEAHGLALGAVDYIHKPITPAIVLARVRNHLELKTARDLLYNQNAYLEQEVERRTRENELIQNITIHSLASLAETRDNETGNHILRTQHYVKLLAEELCDHPRFQDELTPKTIDLLIKSAPLHDIGKVGIPDAILLKPGKLDADEWRLMQQHVVIGEQLVEHIVNDLGLACDDAARIMLEVVAGHHERGDGSGYPRGLLGGLLHQRDAGGVVAHRLACGNRVGYAVAGHQHARAGAHGAIGIGAQLGALAAQAATVVVRVVQQVAQRQFGGGVAAFELDAALRVGVVEQQLVVALAAELLAAYAPLRGVAAMARAVGRGAVPQRAVAAGEVALAGHRVVVRLAEGLRGTALLRLAARRARHAAFALAVVQRADDDGAVDVVFQKLHQYFLADARQELAAHAAAGRALRHAHPAGGVAAVLPVVADAHAAQAVAVDFVHAVRAVAGLGADHDSALRAAS
eukprot:gene39408-47972_t